MAESFGSCVNGGLFHLVPRPGLTQQAANGNTFCAIYKAEINKLSSYRFRNLIKINHRIPYVT